MGGDEALNDFKRSVNEAYPDATIYLFGSRARGDNLKHSDYDILVISDTFAGTNPVRRREHLYQYWDGDEHADIIAYTPEEFERLAEQITVAREAKRDRVKL